MNLPRSIITHDAEHTIRAGREIAKELTAPMLVLLSGELGAGKTTLAKGLISGLGAAPEDEVTSPTFTLVHEFRGASTVVYHIDLYRIDGAADMATLGLEDIFLAPAVIFVEWSEKWRMPSDWPVLKISLAVDDDHTRTITLS